jgi:hypothetical protein
MSRICEVDSTHQRNVDYTDADVVTWNNLEAKQWPTPSHRSIFKRSLPLP